MTFTPLLREFLNELQLAKGKNCLIFVIIDGLPHTLEEKAKESGFEIYSIILHKEDNLFKLVDILLKWNGTGENVVYFVHGIMDQAPDILSYLNLHRDFLTFYQLFFL